MRAILATLLLIFGHDAFAAGSTDVLPKGIRNVQLLMGTVGGLNQYYSESGELGYLSDKNTLTLNEQTLTDFDPDLGTQITDFRAVLNDFGPNNYGDQLFIGNFSVDIQPELSYLAPVFLYGYSDKLTIGVGIPYFSYKTEVNAGLKDSNYEEIRAQIDGISEEVDAAFDQIGADAGALFYSEMNNLEYESLKRSEKFLGDVQLIAAYQFSKKRKQVQTARLFLNLPTGPEPDADDLADVEAFGRTSIKPVYLTSYVLSSRAFLLGSLSYQYILPSSVEKRVPLDEKDALPAPEQKRNLDEKIGDTWSATIAAAWKHSSSFTSVIGYSREEKAQDSYSSSDIGDSSLLEKGTRKSADIGRLEFSYSTIDKFKRGKFAAPMTISYELSSVLSGKNIENQAKHQLGFKLYF